jgi:hypothetical protein
MSTLLPIVDLTSAVVGTTIDVPLGSTGITAYPGQIKDPPIVQIFNESGCGLAGETKLEGDSFFVPAGGWKEVPLYPGESDLIFTVVYQMSNPPISSLVIVYYAPGESRDTIGILGNSPIQGAAVTTAQGGAALQLNGSAVADGTLVNACDFSSAVGGVETSKLTTMAGVAKYAEILSQGGTSASVSAIPATPTHHGWVFATGAGTFAAGAWSAKANISFLSGSGDTITIRFFRYSGGVDTLIGSINTTIIGLPKAIRSWAATSMPKMVMGANDLLEVDLWCFDNTGVAGDNPSIFVSTTTANGVVNDMQVITPAFG